LKKPAFLIRHQHYELRKRRTSLIGDCCEGSRVRYAELSKNLAIQLDVSELEASYELAVANACHAACGIDTNDPDCTEFSLPCASITKSVLGALLDSALGKTEAASTTASEAAGAL
jgi:hypothetical protein